MIAIQPVYWRVGQIYRKNSFLYCCVLDRVYGAVAWQRIDQFCYIAPSLRLLVPNSLTVYHRSFLRFLLVTSHLPSHCTSPPPPPQCSFFKRYHRILLKASLPVELL
jgi:hypothetical protein